MRVGDQSHAQTALPPVPNLQEAGWAHSLSGRVWKISPPPAFDPRTLQPVASRYAGYA